MRVLVTAAVPSHLMSIIPLAWALRSMGHEVLVAGKADVTATARSAGLCTADVREADSGLDARRKAAAKPVSPDGPPDWARMADNWRARVGNVLDSYLETARQFRPDLVVTDPIEYSGPVLAGLLGIPYAVHRWGPESLSSDALPHARTALADLGPFNAPSAIVDPCPPSLQAPEATPASHPLRFVPFNGSGTVPRWPSDGRTRLCVSLGMFGFSVLAGDGSATVLEVLAGKLAGRTDLDVVLPVPAEYLEQVRELPAPVRVVPQVPLNTVLGDCALVLHHGGSGTALTAATFGLPQLVMPQAHPALASCAERLVKTGVAREAGAEPAEVIDEVLASGSEAGRAAELREEMLALPTPAETADALTREFA
ncbi:nucleotide disphospho-sugar-binding domain-containing protein [Amycolatopsis sp. NPDC003676]